MRFLTILLFLPLLAACGQGRESPSYDSWIGRWQGPEGTYLTLQKSDIPGQYDLVIADLDGPRAFKGLSAQEGIAFDRNEVSEIIRPGNGAATGMKWLADKKSCLVIKTGEGYCRD